METPAVFMSGQLGRSVLPDFAGFVSIRTDWPTIENLVERMELAPD